MPVLQWPAQGRGPGLGEREVAGWSDGHHVVAPGHLRAALPARNAPLARREVDHSGGEVDEAVAGRAAEAGRVAHEVGHLAALYPEHECRKPGERVFDGAQYD